MLDATHLSYQALSPARKEWLRENGFTVVTVDGVVDDVMPCTVDEQQSWIAPVQRSLPKKVRYAVLAGPRKAKNHQVATPLNGVIAREMKENKVTVLVDLERCGKGAAQDTRLLEKHGVNYSYCKPSAEQILHETVQRSLRDAYL
jgi:hypothetical protein